MRLTSFKLVKGSIYFCKVTFWFLCFIKFVLRHSVICFLACYILFFAHNSLMVIKLGSWSMSALNLTALLLMSESLSIGLVDSLTKLWHSIDNSSFSSSSKNDNPSWSGLLIAEIKEQIVIILGQMWIQFNSIMLYFKNY